MSSNILWFTNLFVGWDWPGSFKPFSQMCVLIHKVIIFDSLVGWLVPTHAVPCGEDLRRAWRCVRSRVHGACAPGGLWGMRCGRELIRECGFDPQRRRDSPRTSTNSNPSNVLTTHSRSCKHSWWRRMPSTADLTNLLTQWDESWKLLRLRVAHNISVIKAHFFPAYYLFFSGSGGKCLRNSVCVCARLCQPAPLGTHHKYPITRILNDRHRCSPPEGASVYGRRHRRFRGDQGIS